MIKIMGRTLVSIVAGMALAVGIASCSDEELRRVEEPNQSASCEEASEPPNCKDGYSITVSCGYNDSGSKLIECVDGTLVENPCADAEEPPVLSCPDPVVCDPIPECLESAVERDYRTCGINGDGIRVVERSRDCADGLWASWADWTEIVACIDPSYCAEGTTETRSCGINGRGTEIFTCIDGQYVPSGECLDVDICLDESSIDVACGINGRGRTTVNCTDGRLWADICDDIDICRDFEIDYELQEIPCGVNNRGVQYQERVVSCINGQWGEWGDWGNYGGCCDPDECEDSTERTVVCGLNGDGLQQQACIEGVFVDDGACMDDDICQDGLTITAVNCGYNGRGTTTAMCNEGQLTVGVCDDPDICTIGENRYTPDSCGLNGRGTIEEVCVDLAESTTERPLTAWEFSRCIDTDVCVDGTIDTICCGYDGEGTKSRTCLEGVGQWGEYGDCSVDRLVNVSRDVSQDTEPSLDENNLIFNKYSTYIMHIDLNEIGISLPERINDHITNPTGGDIIFSPDEWGITGCTDLDIQGNNVVFRCNFVDDDPIWDDYSYGHIYLMEKTDSGFSEREHLRGYYPSVSSSRFSFMDYSSNNIKVFDNTTGNLIRDFGTGRFPDIDDDSVVFERDSAGKTRVYLGDIVTGATQLISGTGVNDSGYQPSINGNDAVFYSDRDGNKQLYHYNIASATLQRLTNCNNNYEPSVSQGKVAFTSERDGTNGEVYVCDLAAARASESTTGDYCCTNAVNISNSPSVDYQPSISGCKVAFTSERDGNKEIYVYDLCEGGCGGE